MTQKQELHSFIKTVEELVRALTERLANQMSLTDELKAQLSQQQAETRKTLILFPKTPAT